MTEDIKTHLRNCLRQLQLSTFADNFVQQAQLAANEGWSYDTFLLNLCQLEIDARRQRKVESLLQASKLPREKTLTTFDRARLKKNIAQQFARLLTGEFLAHKENVLVFGIPGSGKSHLLAALGHELVHQGHSVCFVPCVLLVQRLLRAKGDLVLEKELKRLDRFAALIIDDIGYVQQSRDEMEVLFTLLAHRYENRSVLLTSNLVFSQWEKIFKDPMTTAAAIDRLVHHSTILELNLLSYRVEAAQKRKLKIQIDPIDPIEPTGV
jgi:DNA replication protein DnaC